MAENGKTVLALGLSRKGAKAVVKANVVSLLPFSLHSAPHF
jgi:hypothetical protein